MPDHWLNFLQWNVKVNTNSFKLDLAEVSESVCHRHLCFKLKRFVLRKTSCTNRIFIDQKTEQKSARILDSYQLRRNQATCTGEQMVEDDMKRHVELERSFMTSAVERAGETGQLVRARTAFLEGLRFRFFLTSIRQQTTVGNSSSRESGPPVWTLRAPGAELYSLPSYKLRNFFEVFRRGERNVCILCPWCNNRCFTSQLKKRGVGMTPLYWGGTVCRSEGNLWESVLSFHQVVFRD